jgi:periplasmic divalent cation tolerance protein
MVTCGSKDEARKIARAVLSKKLAACVNIVDGVESHYWWKGKLEEGAECLLLVKTTTAKTAALTRAIKAAHSYEVPEIIFAPIVRGESRYLKWLRGSVAALAVLFASVMPASADRVDDLLAQLRSGDAEARSEAAEQLAQVGGERARKKFREMIASANVEARQMAAVGLLRVSDEDADLELVRGRLTDEDSMVRWSAALALGQCGRREVLPCLEQVAKSDKSDLVREAAVESAAKLRGELRWLRSLSEALKEARKLKRPVLVYFFVSESEYCRKFEAAVFGAADVVERSREFICVRVNASRAPDDARRWDVRGAPTVLLLDGQGNELSRASGVVEKEIILARMAAARRGTDSFRELQRRAERMPTDVEANWKVAQICLDEGREDAAEIYLRNVIAYDEANRYGVTAKALLALGVVFGHKGEHAKAVYCCEQLLERWPSFEQTDKALYCLGLSRIASRQAAKGRAALEELLREFPRSGVAAAAKEVLTKAGTK